MKDGVSEFLSGSLIKSTIHDTVTLRRDTNLKEERGGLAAAEVRWLLRPHVQLT